MVHWYEPQTYSCLLRTS